jgi:hypothetical protein
MTVTAEIGGMALALQLASGVGPKLHIPDTESAATYWYFAISLFGAAMTRRLLCSWRWLLEHSVAARLTAA